MQAMVTKRILRRGISLGMCNLLLVGLILVVASPAVGLWLPWTTERDRIQKIANDMWYALVNNDLKTARAFVGGDGAENFIKQEMSLIKNLKIKSYECHVKKFQIDTVTGTKALVVLEKIATQKNGRKLKRLDMSVFRKIGGQWKIVMEKPKRRRSLEDIDALDEGPLPGEKEPPGSKNALTYDASAPSGPAMNIPSIK